MLSIAAATDEVNDLDAVAIAKRRRCPVTSANDIEIDFDRDPRRFQSEFINKRLDGQAVRKFSGFSVELNLHEAD